MKTCPKCQAQYDDYMRFCLQDGTPLAGDDIDAPTDAITEIYDFPKGTDPKQTEAVTEEWRGQNQSTETIVNTNQNQANSTNQFATAQTQVESQPNKSGKGFIFGALLIGGLLILGSAIGGTFWYLNNQKSNKIVSTNTNQTNTANLSNTEETPNFDISNANLSDSSNKPETNSKEIANAKTSPTLTPKPTVTPKPEPSKTPEKTPTPEVKPTPTPTAEDDDEPTPTGRSRPISGGVLNGKAVSLPKPNYPQAAKAGRVSGAVNVQVLIDENGNVRRVKAVSGHPLLKNSAERAARSAKFRPTLVGGQPVRVTGVIVYNFVP